MFANNLLEFLICKFLRLLKMLILPNFANFSDIFGNILTNIVIAEQCKGVHSVDLGESFQTHIYYLLAKFGFNTAENEPCQVCLISDLITFIFITVRYYSVGLRGRPRAVL